MELLRKMKRKEETELTLIHAPSSFAETRNSIMESVKVSEDLDNDRIGFLLVFFHNISEIEETVPVIMEKVDDDTLLWAAYPKKASRNISSDITRDRGWEIFGKYGYEPVGQISIDEDWSALRFRPVKLIRNFRRNEKMVLSDEGKERLEKEK